jgi:murein DD-endopeptidase MepM/ murein hydrolase activator NlpD
VSEPKLIPVQGRKTPAHGTEGIWSWQPDGDLIGTVIYVHGLFDSADTAWKGTLGSFTEKKFYKRPKGKPLKDQFEKSGVKALFLVPEAEINVDNGSEVVWRSLQDLLDAAGAKGPVVALSHSAGYATVYHWLKHKDLMHISLIDSMWGYRDAYAKWLAADGHTIDLIGAGSTPRSHFKEMVKAWPNDTVEDKTPPALAGGSLQAKVVWMKDPYDHMDLIAEGKLIPLLLKRADAALLRAAGKPAPGPTQQAAKPAPAVFEAGSDDETHHVVDNALQSELKDVPDLAQMAALHHLVLKPGTKHPDAVKAIQKALNKVMGTKLAESGTYDSDTGQAVHDFQTRWNDLGKQPPLDVDGRLGAHTLLALDKALLDTSFSTGGEVPEKPAAVRPEDDCGAEPTTREKEAFELYKRAIGKAGKFLEKPWQMNVVGVQAYLNGKVVPNEPGKFNDTLALVYQCSAGHKHAFEAAGTVDPGLDVHDGHSDVHLEPGQYEYVPGEWNGAACLKPKGKVQVWVDDGTGAEHHSAPREDANDLFIAGAPGDDLTAIEGGHQLVVKDSWQKFWELLQKDPDQEYRYTLTYGPDLKAKADEPVKSAKTPQTPVDQSANTYRPRFSSPAKPLGMPLEFAPAGTGLYWPVVTSDKKKGGVINYFTADGSLAKGASPTGCFMGIRQNGMRVHLGVDLWSNPGDVVIAIEDGIVVASSTGYYTGEDHITKKPFSTGCIFVKNKSNGLVLNYGEVDEEWVSPKSHPKTRPKKGFAVGEEIKAGQQIATIAINGSRGGMLHFETHKPGTTWVAPHWMRAEKPPEEIVPTHKKADQYEVAIKWVKWLADNPGVAKPPKNYSVLNPTAYLLDIASK